MFSHALELISGPPPAGPNHYQETKQNNRQWPKWHWGHGTDPGGTTYSGRIRSAIAFTRMLFICTPVGGVPCRRDPLLPSHPVLACNPILGEERVLRAFACPTPPTLGSHAHQPRTVYSRSPCADGSLRRRIIVPNVNDANIKNKKTTRTWNERRPFVR